MKRSYYILFLLAFMAASVGFISTAAPQTKRKSDPARHFRIEKPGHLSMNDALSIYALIKTKMAKGYGLSRNPLIKNYTNWRRFNKTPYLSATHGNRYINTYGNARSHKYSTLKPGEKLQTGAVLAKDSFTVTRTQGIFAGAVFVMQKLKHGASPKTGDWRYVQIMPDGSLFGDSGGDGASKMKFCYGCHRNASKTDYLFNVREKYRRQFLN